MGTFDNTTRENFLKRIFDQNWNQSLGFNIVRFNIGGAQLNDPNGTTPGTDFGLYRGIPSFQFPNSSYYWEADMAQVQIAQDIARMGVNVFEAFCNSRKNFFSI
jgi:hypothetical protein